MGSYDTDMNGRERNIMKKIQKMLNLTAQEWNWVLYDIGNSAFILLVTAIVPIYFNALTEAANLTDASMCPIGASPPPLPPLWWP